MMYPSAPWKLICSTYHRFPFLFALLHFMNNWQVFLEKDAYLTSAPGWCSQFLVESKFLIYFCYFVCIILVILCSFLCLSVFHVWSLSLDYILLIYTRILVTWLFFIVESENISFQLYYYVLKNVYLFSTQLILLGHISGLMPLHLFYVPYRPQN